MSSQVHAGGPKHSLSEPRAEDSGTLLCSGIQLTGLSPLLTLCTILCNKPWLGVWPHAEILANHRIWGGLGEPPTLCLSVPECVYVHTGEHKCALVCACEVCRYVCVLVCCVISTVHAWVGVLVCVGVYLCTYSHACVTMYNGRKCV